MDLREGGSRVRRIAPCAELRGVVDLLGIDFDLLADQLPRVPSVRQQRGEPRVVQRLAPPPLARAPRQHQHRDVRRDLGQREGQRRRLLGALRAIGRLHLRLSEEQEVDLVAVAQPADVVVVGEQHVRRLDDRLDVARLDRKRGGGGGDEVGKGADRGVERHGHEAAQRAGRGAAADGDAEADGREEVGRRPLALHLLRRRRRERVERPAPSSAARSVSRASRSSTSPGTAHTHVRWPPRRPRPRR